MYRQERRSSIGPGIKKPKIVEFVFNIIDVVALC